MASREFKSVDCNNSIVSSNICYKSIQGEAERHVLRGWSTSRHGMFDHVLSSSIYTMRWKAKIQNGKALRAFISDNPSGMDFDAMAFVEGCTLIYKCYEEMAKYSLFQDEGSYERDELEEQMLLLEGEARTPNYDPLPDHQEAERGDIEEHLANCGFDSFSQWFDCRLHELYDFADKYRLFIAL